MKFKYLSLIALLFINNIQPMKHMQAMDNCTTALYLTCIGGVFTGAALKNLKNCTTSLWQGKLQYTTETALYMYTPKSIPIDPNNKHYQEYRKIKKNIKQAKKDLWQFALNGSMGLSLLFYSYITGYLC